MKHAALLVVALVLAARPARAEFYGEAQDVARDVAESAIDRVRRGIAIGPEVGYFAGVTADGDAQAGLSFGLALYRFHTPSMKQRILQATRRRVTSRLAELVRTGRITDLRNVPSEVLEDVRREAAGEIEPRLLEKPRFKVVVEGALLQAPGGFGARALVGYGIGFASLGLHGGFQHSDDTTMVIAGPELSMSLTPVGKVRTPVVDLFTRTDFGFGNGERMVAFVGGARLTLDVL